MTSEALDELLARVPVLDSHMAYRTNGGDLDAPTAVFLHGNPTSSFIWRKILDAVGPAVRGVAPDLIGFGQSGQPPIAYRFTEIAAYLDAFLEQMGIGSAFLVAQDWGTALAFHLAARRPDLVRGLAFMEFIRPMPTWQDFHQHEQARDTFKALRTPDVGEELIFGQNVFVERILPGSVARELTGAEMDVYRSPFLASGSRTPTLSLPRELPVEGTPADVEELLTEAHRALRSSTYPKLLFVGNPGALVSPRQAAEFCAGLTNIQIVQLPGGMHYLQEDHPELIGGALADWVGRCERELLPAPAEGR